MQLDLKNKIHWGLDFLPYTTAIFMLILASGWSSVGIFQMWFG